MIFEKLENPLRIKITGKCNRNCFFCHREGGMCIEDVMINQKWKNAIEKISSVFHINSVAITGGEPFCHPALSSVLRDISTCKGIKKISLTTNGTIQKDSEFWDEVFSSGLYKVNVSMPDMLTIIDGYGGIDLDNSPFSAQLSLIRFLIANGIRVKINCAVFHDYHYTAAVLKSLLNIPGIDIVLLPNITNQNTFEYSWNVIEEIIANFSFQKIGVRRRFHTSDTIIKYENCFGQKIDIKTTKYDSFIFTALCEKCPIINDCQEGFYGLRMEQIDDTPMIRLCIHRSDSGVLMPVSEFLSSDIRPALEKLWSCS